MSLVTEHLIGRGVVFELIPHRRELMLAAAKPRPGARASGSRCRAESTAAGWRPAGSTPSVGIASLSRLEALGQPDGT